MLVESAKSPILPAPLRRELARSTWTRATVLGNMAEADQLQAVIAELDKPLWNAMEPFRSAKTNEEKRFAAAFEFGAKPVCAHGPTALGNGNSYEHKHAYCRPPLQDGEGRAGANPGSPSKPEPIGRFLITKSLRLWLKP